MVAFGIITSSMVIMGSGTVAAQQAFGARLWQHRLRSSSAGAWRWRRLQAYGDSVARSEAVLWWRCKRKRQAAWLGFSVNGCTGQPHVPGSSTAEQLRCRRSVAGYGWMDGLMGAQWLMASPLVQS